MKKIVIIDHEPLTIRRKQIYYIKELQEQGFDIEFWDCSRYFHPSMVLPEELDEPYKIELKTLSEIERELSRIEDVNNTLFIVEVMYYNNKEFFKLLQDRGIAKIKLELYSTATLRTTEIEKWRKIFKITPKKLFNVAKNRVKRQLFVNYARKHNITQYDILISSGNNPAIDTHINHPDWEMFRNLAPYKHDKEYAAFLDEYFPLHPDMFFFAKNFHADAVTYQNIMKSFFENYSKKNKLDFIIAAHPKAEYRGAEFGDYKCIKYQSAAIAKGAQTIFAHASSSIAYAVMGDKPIALIYTNDYKKTFSLYAHLQRFAILLNIPIQNLDTTKFEDIKTYKIEPRLRENYIYSYLTSPSIQDKSNIDILYKLFSSL